MSKLFQNYTGFDWDEGNFEEKKKEKELPYLFLFLFVLRLHYAVRAAITFPKIAPNFIAFCISPFTLSRP